MKRRITETHSRPTLPLSLSPGVRSHPDFPTSGDLDWGGWQWFSRVPSLCIRSSQKLTSHLARILLRDRFHLCEVPLPNHFTVEFTGDTEGMYDAVNKVDLTESARFVRDVFLRPE